MDKDPHRLLAGGHTLEWEFESHIREYYKDYNEEQVKFHCACGWKSPVRKWGFGDSLSIKRYGTKEKAYADLWEDYMSHRYGEVWTEAHAFDKIWNECFPTFQSDLIEWHPVRAISNGVKSAGRSLNHWFWDDELHMAIGTASAVVFLFGFILMISTLISML